jgi:hypothetical protein
MSNFQAFYESVFLKATNVLACGLERVYLFSGHLRCRKLSLLSTERNGEYMCRN